MSSRGDVKTVDIETQVYKRLSELAQSQRISIRKYVNQILAAHVMVAPYYQKKLGKISVVGPTDMGVIVDDKFQNQMAKVELDIKTGNLHCSLCKRDFCEHIFISFLSPHWITVLKKLTDR